MIYWLFPFYCWFLLKYHWNEFWWSVVFSTEVLYHNGNNSLREKLSVFCCFLSHLFHGSVLSFLVQVELLLQFLLFSIYLLMFRKQTESTGFSILSPLKLPKQSFDKSLPLHKSHRCSQSRHLCEEGCEYEHEQLFVQPAGHPYKTK